MRLELILNKKRQKLSVKEGTTARDLVIRKKLSPRKTTKEKRKTIKCLCGKAALITVLGRGYCKSCFNKRIQKKFFQTLKKQKMVSSGDHIAIAFSGGKDSVVLLDLFLKFRKRTGLNLTFSTITVNEGIKSYREPQIPKLKKYLNNLKRKNLIEDYKLVDIKSLGFSIDDIKKILVDRKGEPGLCSFCGTFRRYLVSKTAREIKATKVAFGHNLDDYVQTQLMNIFDNNMERFLSLEPKLTSPYFVHKISRLIDITEKEIAAYALFNNLHPFFEDCPYLKGSKRHFFRRLLNKIEDSYIGSKVKAKYFLDSVMEKIPTKERKKLFKRVVLCKVCGEPTTKKICNTCEMLENLNKIKRLKAKQKTKKQNKKLNKEYFNVLLFIYLIAGLSSIG